MHCVKNNNPPWHAKDRFTNFRWREGLWGPPGKLQNIKTDHISLIVVAVTWLKYCRYGVKSFSINQSIKINRTHQIHIWRRTTHYYSCNWPSVLCKGAPDSRRPVLLRDISWRLHNIWFHCGTSYCNWGGFL